MKLRKHWWKRASAQTWPVLGALVLSACSDGLFGSRGDSGGNSSGNAPGNGSNGGNESAAGGSGASANGASGNGSGGSGVDSGGNAGTGTGGASSGASGAGTAGQNNGGAGAGGAVHMGTGITVTTFDVSVGATGTVFNVEDNYFNDGFIPRTPVANFGTHSPIIAVTNEDGSLDVAWLDYTDGESQPWAVRSPSMIYVSHVDPALQTATTEATGLNSYKLLGFTKDASGVFYVAYNQDHALKTDVEDDENSLNGNELHVARLNAGGTAWDQLLFGNQDNNANDTKGDTGGAASSVLGYDAVNDKLALYLGHSMMWEPVRHQAGYFRLLEPDTGNVVAPAGDDIIHFGSGWFYSHNFNQRLIIDGGDYYMLAHGDAYARQLGFARWSFAGYVGNNESDFDESYFDIAGEEGDNNTDAQTGQFVRLPDGRFLMVHTTSQGRGARDVRVVAADAATGAVDQAGAVWLTENTGDTHATMAKVEVLGANVLVTYALWTGDHDLTWYATVLGPDLVTLSAPEVVPDVEFIDSAPLFRFSGGPHSGKVGWVSGNAAHTLTVGVAAPSVE